ncbi:hypothetical protein, partial [Prevotella multiformis]|uniref:hypothetical protein n=1 Tax=Prevotella multiformis TaxID=282402 RepID=UPI003F9F559D
NKVLKTLGYVRIFTYLSDVNIKALSAKTQNRGKLPFPLTIPNPLKQQQPLPLSYSLLGSGCSL